MSKNRQDSEKDGYDPDKLARDEAFVREGFWDKVRATAGRIPFSEDAVAAYFCAIDKQTPAYIKAMLFGAIAYFIMPMDVIPDFLAGLGFTDDASVLAATLAAVTRHLRPEHRDKARTMLKKDADDSAA